MTDVLTNSFLNAVTGSLSKSLPTAVAQRFNQINPEEFESFLRDWLKEQGFKESSSSKGRSKREKKTDPNAPKRNKSAYIFFCEGNRVSLMKKSPDMKMTDISKELGKLWLSTSETDKHKYEQLAAQDKARYEQELAAYKNSQHE